MLSSLNAYGGLSANQLLSLFGAKPTAAAHAPQSPSSPASPASRGPDPASAIKSILARSQIARSSVLTLGGATAASDGTSSLTVVSVTRAPIGLNIEQLDASQSPSPPASGGAAAPASAIESSLAPSEIAQSSALALVGATAASDGSSSLAFVSVTRAPIGPIIAQSAFSEIASAGAVAGMNYNAVIGVYQATSYSNAIAAPASASAPADASSLMEFSRTIANSSVGVGFTVAGLEPMTVGYGDVYSPLTPQGTYSVSFQLNFDAAQGTAREGASCTAGGQDMFVTGLSAAQAQSLQQELATGGAAAPAASAYNNTENLDGMDVEFTSWISGDAPTANVSGA